MISFLKQEKDAEIDAAKNDNVKLWQNDYFKQRMNNFIIYI